MARSSVEDLLRQLAANVLAVVTRRCGDFDRAEDAVHEALRAAERGWPVDGLPDDPRGWLITMAELRMTDLVRSEEAPRRESRAPTRDPVGATAEVPEHDDTLLLMFMCAHPVLSPASAIPLTLRAVGGLTTAEIARALVVPEATMAQRISRAKHSITAAGGSFGPPASGELGERLRSVLQVLHLIFTDGHPSTSGTEVAPGELSVEAIRLARMVHRLLPDEPEVDGLLAMMLLNEARRPARTGSGGELVTLAEQDRSRWDTALIAEGTALVMAALPKGRVGEYQLQAAIAALHDRAAVVEETDWPQILALYAVLERMTEDPMITLDRALATAMVDGPAAGLVILDHLDTLLAGHHRLAAVRAHLLEMAGDREAALAHYRIAATRTTNIAERDYLTTQASRLCIGSVG